MNLFSNANVKQICQCPLAGSGGFDLPDGESCQVPGQLPDELIPVLRDEVAALPPKKRYGAAAQEDSQIPKEKKENKKEKKCDKKDKKDKKGKKTKQNHHENGASAVDE